MTPRALVTGSEGFVGRHVVPLLKQKGYEVTEIDKRDALFPKTVEGFISQERRNGFSHWDCVLHFAANIEDIDARTRGGVQMFQDIALDYAMAEYLEMNPPKEAVVWMTSCATDWAKEDPYSWVKLNGEKLCGALAKKGVPVKILRPYSGYGHTQALSYPFPAILKRAMEKQDPLTVWGSGKQTRDFVHIDDLARACVHAIKHFPIGEPVEICTGTGTDFITLAQMMADAVGYKPEIHCDTTKAEASPRRVGNPAVAKFFGFEAKVSLEDGIRRAIEHYTKHGF